MLKRKHGSAVNVLLLDDRSLVQDEYRRLLSGDSRLQIMAHATSDSANATELLLAQADVVMLDVSSNGVRGLDALKQVLARRPSARVLMLSAHTDCVYATHAFDAGAWGYVSKPASAQTMGEAIRALVQGNRYVSPDVRRMLAGQPADTHRVVTSLSRREHEILKLLTQGLSLQGIAAHLGITVKTVANRQSAIKAKLGAETALQLMVIARRLGLDQ